MTYVKSWEEFEKAAERLYLQDPMKVRYSMKYTHNKGCLSLKLTDDVDKGQYLATPQLKQLVAGFPQWQPRFDSGFGQVGFVVDKVALRQVFSEYFSFP
ncbi:Signal recognition particle 9 kDa protein [Cryptotermes secundus]|uniref:Signal recognition particle 9 kDa protein n=1 Tax=Cryptotermes secundus TaxID=105785 RepID=A0A2J7R654_9NEOP|nr:Signal recognition particle 9 kDa protein [Cryptotermes secundus]